MPFLRFTRDKRGYETTSLVHAIRRQGRSRQHILYWFRTPPGVKVGRPALDEEAIRWIEEHNPDIQFDWQKILEAQPPAGHPPEDSKPRRPRRAKPERRRTGERPSGELEAHPGSEPQTHSGEPQGPDLVSLASDFAPDMDAVDGEEQGPPDDPENAITADALEQMTHPDAEEVVEPMEMPVDHALDAEQLIRLRGRYAEIQRRITERGGERIEELRQQAESLNPDGWVTEVEVRAGLEEFENRMRDLRSALGLRRRRRSRRGGRRSRPQEPDDGG